MGQQCAGCPSGEPDAELMEQQRDTGMESVPGGHALRFVDHMSKWSPDTVGPEALQWVNKLLEILWPEMDKVARHIVHDKITPRMQEKAGQKMPQLKDMHFSHFTLGTATPKVTGLHVSTTPFGGSKVRMMVDYKSDIAVEVLAMKMKVGMRAFHLSGEMCVLMRPVMEDYPGNVGGMTMYFVNRPRIDLDFTGLANIADLGGIKGIVRQTIGDVLAEKLVLPNAITNVIGYDDLLVYPPVMGPPHPPVAAVSIRLVKAADIRDGDFHLNPFATKVEDNYVKYVMGDVTWKAPIGNLPQERTFTVMDVMQTMSISVWDEDSITADDFLGTVGTYTMSEIEALSGRDIQVNDPSRKEGKGGVLQMEVHFFNIKPFRLGPSENIVVIQFQEVFLHFKPEGKVFVRAKLGSETRTTRASNPMTSAVKSKTVQSVIKDMQERLRKEGVQEDLIERVTVLEGLQAVSSFSRVPLNINISFPVATKDMGSGMIDIEVVQQLTKKKEHVLGTYRHALEVFGSDPSKELDEKMEIDGDGGKIEVKASMFVCALEKGSAPVGGKLEPSDFLAQLPSGRSVGAASASGEKAGESSTSPGRSGGGGWKFHFPFSKSNTANA